MTFYEWVASVDWLAVAGSIAIPVAAILISARIAVRLSRAERDMAREDNQRERRLNAGASVIVALAPLASLQAIEQQMQERLWELRARIAVYRAWIVKDDVSGDWLALRHQEGMRLWLHAMSLIDAAGGPNRLAPHQFHELLSPAHEWAASTTEMFSGWLSGSVKTEALQNDGARILDVLKRDSTVRRPGPSR